MISRQVRAMADQLAAEGVALWLAASGAEEVPAEELWAPDALPFVLGATFDEVAVDTVRRTCAALWPVYTASEGRDGRVSVPVSPRTADEVQDLAAAVRSLWAAVGQENLMVRVPATRAGLAALRDSLAAGISVEVAPVYSPELYGEVLDAYFAGMERALLNGHCLQRIASVASVPVGRLHAEVEARLAGAAEDSSLGRAAVVAVARLMYRLRETRLDGEWWQTLRSAGAYPPRLVWASVPSEHVGALVGSNTAQTVSVSVLETAARTVRLLGDTLLNAHAEAERTLSGLERLGIRVPDVARTLQERERERLRPA